MGESCRRWLGGTQSQIISQSQIICAGEGKSRRMTRSKSFLEFFWEVLCSFSSLLGRSREFGIVRGAKKTFVLLYETETCIALEWQACLGLSVRGPFW